MATRILTVLILSVLISSSLAFAAESHDWTEVTLGDWRRYPVDFQGGMLVSAMQGNIAHVSKCPLISPTIIKAHLESAPALVPDTRLFAVAVFVAMLSAGCESNLKTAVQKERL